jgi:6-phosphofructokinase 1
VSVAPQGHCVVVVSEGAGEELLGTHQKKLDQAAQAAGAHAALPAIGEYLKKQVTTHFKAQGKPINIKYIDPSYMIRSVPANGADSLYCMLLGQNAVHAAMAGFTGVSVGLCNNRVVLLPIELLGEHSPRNMSPYGRTWERVLSVCARRFHLGCGPF